MTAAFKQQITARALADVPVYPTFDASPLVIDVSWARSIRGYGRVVRGDGPGPLYMRVGRYLQNDAAAAATPYYDTLRNLSSITTVDDISTAVLNPYMDSILLTADRFNFWLNTDGTSYISFGFAEAGGVVPHTQVELIVVPQFGGVL